MTPNLDNHKSLILLIFCIVSLEHDIKGEIILKGIVRSKKGLFLPKSKFTHNLLPTVLMERWLKLLGAGVTSSYMKKTTENIIKCIHTAPVMSSVSIWLTFRLDLQQHDDAVCLSILFSNDRLSSIKVTASLLREIY